MIKQVLFIQGGGPGAHEDWDAVLVKSLQDKIGPDCRISYPALPHEETPTYSDWKQAILAELVKLEAGAFIVAHSVGATVLLHTLAEYPLPAAPTAIFLLAPPFVGKDGWDNDEIREKPNLGQLLPARTRIYLYHGDDDEITPPRHADLYAAVIPQAVIRRLPGRNHQFGNDLREIAIDIRDTSRREYQ